MNAIPPTGGSCFVASHYILQVRAGGHEMDQRRVRVLLLLEAPTQFALILAEVEPRRDCYSTWSR